MPWRTISPPPMPSGPRSLSERVISRLARMQVTEPDIHLRDDYGQALMTVAYARDGSPIPHIESSYRKYGCHPDQVWPRIVAYRQAMIGQPISMQAFKAAREARAVRLEAQRANVESAASLRGPQESAGNLHALPKPARSEKQESLQEMLAEAVRKVAR